MRRSLIGLSGLPFNPPAHKLPNPAPFSLQGRDDLGRPLLQRALAIQVGAGWGCIVSFRHATHAGSCVQEKLQWPKELDKSGPPLGAPFQTRPCSLWPPHTPSSPAPHPHLLRRRTWDLTTPTCWPSVMCWRRRRDAPVHTTTAAKDVRPGRLWAQPQQAVGRRACAAGTLCWQPAQVCSSP